jgi:hypothetical protein
MRSYLQAYQDVWKAGYVLEDSLKKHIDYHLLIDKHLPDTASFFYVVKFPDGLYNFLGRQQEAVSGYSNEEFFARGVSLFLENIHPEEIEIILHQVYPDITSFPRHACGGREKAGAYPIQLPVSTKKRRLYQFAGKCSCVGTGRPGPTGYFPGECHHAATPGDFPSPSFHQTVSQGRCSRDRLQ